MKKLNITLNTAYKSFETGFSQELTGDLIILSGVNGSGKSQLMDTIYGFTNKDKHNPINRVILLNGEKIKDEDISHRSFKDFSSLHNINEAGINNRNETRGKLWQFYQRTQLPEMAKHKSSWGKMEKILLDEYGEEKFRNHKITLIDLGKVIPSDFILYSDGDIFSNKIGDIFFGYAFKDLYEKAHQIDSSNISLAITTPWTILNNLFKELRFDYRFEEHYEMIESLTLNKQPEIFAVGDDGKADLTQKRELADLSDGEKAIISLTFAVLGSEHIQPKILLLDEYDAPLNPSLTNAFFVVLKKFFVDKGTQVIIATHSYATLSLAPNYARFYEVYRPKKDRKRLLEVDRESYQELRVVNTTFIDKVQDQEKRYKELKQLHDEKEAIFHTFEKRSKLATHILIAGEGKTDVTHLKNAMKKLEVMDLEKLEFFDSGKEDGFGSKNLKIFLEQSALIPHLNPIIGIFDRDEKDIITEIEKDGALYKNYGNNVYAFCIPLPDSRKDYTHISIEFYFADEELKKENNGKRLCFDNEIDVLISKKTKVVEIRKLLTPDYVNESNKKIFCENIGESNWIHSKTVFANLVMNDPEFSKDFNFENFHLIFDRINLILEDSKKQKV
jgi:energy-coupling factor transporter ATP-binding protein EcfA2